MSPKIKLSPKNVHLPLSLASLLHRPPFPNRYTKSLPAYHKPREYLELGLTCPLPSDFLVPSCSKQILCHSFANIINAPRFSTHYSMPFDCLSLSSDCLDFGPFRSLADTTRFGLNRRFHLIQPESARVVEKKKKQLADAASTHGQRCPRVSRRVRHRCGPSNSESVLPRFI